MKEYYNMISHKWIAFTVVMIFSIGLAWGQSPLTFDLDNTNHIEAKELSKGTYQFVTKGNDPYVQTSTLERNLRKGEQILSFEYFCTKGLNHIQLFFRPEDDLNFNKLVKRVGAAEGWVSYTIDIGDFLYDWGETGDRLRIDFGSKPDVTLQIRNLQIRNMTARELEIAENKARKKRQEALVEEHLRTYFSTEYSSKIDNVSVTENTVEISGSVQGDQAILVEISPDMDVTEEQNFFFKQPVAEGNLSVKLDRYIEREGRKYDRLLSKWTLMRKDENDSLVLISHARYVDSIQPKYQLPNEQATSKKGLGGFSFGRGHVEDLDELDIKSATINIWFTRFMFTKPAPDRIEHVYNGKSWYFRKKEVGGFDETFRATAEKNIITAAILLVSKAEQCPDPEIGKMLQHPDMDPAGIYSMPNMTNPASVECYAAALDFLASRYSREDKIYGRINHWIMHNEVDAGWVWTNMGEKTELIFMDTYIKSMRMCYNIARSYNPFSEVFVTLTHYWAWTSHPQFYPSKNLMEILLNYTRVEGDFEWAVAQHPYPESLFEPKTWLDQKVDFTYNSPLITFKNIEVLDSWIKQPEVLYKGKKKRTLWLSENGTNSKTYSEQDLKEQAAGFAYTWNKLKRLDGIDGFQWHNWFDHRGEGGLRIGLRRFPDDEEDPGGKKPVWYAYQAADRENEDEVFDQYKSLIGIEDWDQLNFIGDVNPDVREKSYRDIKADTWVAADALGRELPNYEEVGPQKDDRYVGMFYFMTHLNEGKPGPFDVTKIKAENPTNPQWGKGAHYWGEPEIGYYQNNEKWAIRRHAYQLADAGVDVIIFDVTNNRTYPDVYLNVCEVWREMRAAGEKTPDIAFLGSEISVNKLWDDFYKKGMYPELWFMWKGKPLLLYGQHEIPSRNKVNDIEFSNEIKKFFSLRQSWAWTSLPWYDEGKDEWPWIDHFPQTIGWHENANKPEQVPVAAAQHPLSNIGRSFHQFHQPETNEYDLTPFTDQGLFFQEQWDHALEVDPEFIFVTGWNEWSAGQQVMKEPVNENLKKWKFYPGAHLGKAGKPLKVGDTYFIDQYNQEFSRDIEPMKGGHTDNYYYQLVANVRKYKGVRKPQEVEQKVTIDVGGSFDQWSGIEAVYHDHIGDVAHRDSRGDRMAGAYINTTGRNDIIESRVTHDDDNIYFYVKAGKALNSHNDNNWMLLFINTDQNQTTGWEGYDFLINAEILSDKTTKLKQYKKGKWKDLGELAYKYDGNELMLKVSKSLLGVEKLQFDFHWADNIQQLNDITEFFNSGDSAPDRRFNYRFDED
ncbi:MAG: hypothetical protein JXQ96_07120 [Cyclobacteriaceae bacterium]